MQWPADVTEEAEERTKEKFETKEEVRGKAVKTKQVEYEIPGGMETGRQIETTVQIGERQNEDL